MYGNQHTESRITVYMLLNINYERGYYEDKQEWYDGVSFNEGHVAKIIFVQQSPVLSKGAGSYVQLAMLALLRSQGLCYTTTGKCIRSGKVQVFLFGSHQRMVDIKNADDLMWKRENGLQRTWSQRKKCLTHSV